jgi:hypothetical protein
LATKDVTTYLGVDITTDLTWSHHVDRIAAKANQTLGFLRRNLQRAPTAVKEQAYKTLVRPALEYSSSVWDPHTKKDSDQIEKIQRRAARFALSRYHNTSSVTDMLKSLNWEQLQQRRAKARVTMMYKITYNLVAIPLYTYVQPAYSRTRGSHEHKLQCFTTHTDYYRLTFFPRTVIQWNGLPVDVIDSTTLDLFKQRLSKIQIPIVTSTSMQ